MDPMVLLAMLLAGAVILIVLFILISILIGTICYKIAFGVVDAKNEDWKSVLITSVICALVGWIPCLGCILCWYIIKSRHDLSWGKAIIVWLIAVIVSGAIAYGISLLFI